AVEVVEARASPAPADEGHDNRHAHDRAHDSRGDDGRRDGRAGEADDRAEPGEIGRGKAEAGARGEAVARVEASHGATRSRRVSIRAGPIPGTASSSSTEVNAPCFVR